MFEASRMTHQAERSGCFACFEGISKRESASKLQRIVSRTLAYPGILISIHINSLHTGTMEGTYKDHIICTSLAHTSPRSLTLSQPMRHSSTAPNTPTTLSLRATRNPARTVTTYLRARNSDHIEPAPRLLPTKRTSFPLAACSDWARLHLHGRSIVRPAYRSHE